MQHTDRAGVANGGLQTGGMVPYGLKLPTPTPALVHFQNSTMSNVSPSTIDLQRAQQLYDYNARLQYTNAMRAYGAPHGMPYPMHPHEALAHAFFAKQLDPRARFLHEEPKPAQSYIGLISMAILQNKEHKLVLADIYQWIMDNFAYFRNRGPGWRNSIRHNLSLNDCFIKNGRSANGKGHYWSIHPANKEDFKRGDFRRRRAQRKVRKAMGLAVPDDEDDSPSPPPATTTVPDWSTKVLGRHTEDRPQISPPTQPMLRVSALPVTRKRLFDVESLLAPDIKEEEPPQKQLRLSSDSDEMTNKVEDEDDDDDAPLDVCDTDDEKDFLRSRSGLIIIEPTCPEEDRQAAHQHSTSPQPEDHDRTEASNYANDSSVTEAPPTPDSSSPRSVSPTSITGSPICSSPSSTPSSTLSSPPTEARGTLGCSPVLSAPSWALAAAKNSAFHGQNIVARECYGQMTAGSHPAIPNSVPSMWSGLPSPVYPMLAAPFPLPTGGSPAEQAQAAQKWHETVTRFMARSYEKNVKLEA